MPSFFDFTHGTGGCPLSPDLKSEQQKNLLASRGGSCMFNRKRGRKELQFNQAKNHGTSS
jgi:hypothetical protein